MMLRSSLGAVMGDAVWCANASAWNPIAYALCLPNDAANLYSKVVYGQSLETPPPPAPAPRCKTIDATTGACDLETPAEMQARYRAEVTDFFGGIADKSKATQCSKPWAVFDSECNGSPVLLWGLVALGAVLLVGGGRR